MRPIGLVAGHHITSYSTYNPSDKASSITLSSGNNKATIPTAAGSYQSVRGTLSHSTGKYYLEFTCNQGLVTSIDTVMGFMTSADGMSGNYPGSDATGFGCQEAGGYLNNGNFYSSYFDSWTTGNTIQLAVDIGNKLFWVSVIGGSGWNKGSGNPAAGTGGKTFTPSGSLFPASSLYESTQSHSINTGGSSFSGSIPSGFSAWG